jgi:protein-S-isoprenylcysteine O-methyltransferase Ste14
VLRLAGEIVARWTLGKAFSVTSQARQLVTEGVYYKIRHPICVFSSVLLAGLILMMQWRYLWAVLGLIVIIQVLRARRRLGCWKRDLAINIASIVGAAGSRLRNDWSFAMVFRSQVP